MNFTELYEKKLESGYSSKQAGILVACVLLGVLVGNVLGWALSALLVMWVFNLLAPLVGISIVLTFWQAFAFILVWRFLKRVVKSLFRK